MGLFKKKISMLVCQNCKNGINKKGKWKKRRFRKDTWEEGTWHIFCEKKQKYFPWNKHKKCFESEPF